MQQIISAEQLEAAKRVLFILDLSLKDFLFVQSYILGLAKIYPGIKIDLWVNANCNCLFGHKKIFVEKLFLEFLQECEHLGDIYLNTCVSRLLKENVSKARAFEYKFVFIFSKLNLVSNIKLAKSLNPGCFLVGPDLGTKWYSIFKRLRYKFLGARLNWHSDSLKDLYKNIFGQLFGMEDHKAQLSIPRKWITYAKLKFMKWGIDKKGQRFGKVFFINSFDDNEKCSCSLKKVLSLILDLKRHDEWGDINFVLHVPPSRLRFVRKFFAKHSINNLYLFSADNNFYQIPSILSLCDGVFSVDGICAELSVLLNVNSIDDMTPEDLVHKNFKSV